MPEASQVLTGYLRIGPDPLDPDPPREPVNAGFQGIPRLRKRLPQVSGFSKKAL
jgi:hypothetical protein